MWIKRGNFVVVDESGREEAVESGRKVGCVVTKVLYYEQVRLLQKSPQRPEIFKSVAVESSKQEVLPHTPAANVPAPILIPKPGLALCTTDVPGFGIFKYLGGVSSVLWEGEWNLEYNQHWKVEEYAAELGNGNTGVRLWFTCHNREGAIDCGLVVVGKQRQVHICYPSCCDPQA
ncbi:hypothetical protein K7X08_026578 [Anisodus acutangulus]|uniref:Uncharacterized protein n=1 Tax=Anisodus acutangulus TaxID=402998 RepID=A0A9Q1R4T3_9SOLA|nr:hypothetical protein K7X08_026578 [Anisodus acutangulus]